MKEEDLKRPLYDLWLHMLYQARPMYVDCVLNTYTKDGLFCICRLTEKGQIVQKYPVIHIFRVEEEY